MGWTGLLSFDVQLPINGPSRQILKMGRKWYGHCVDAAPMV